MITPAIGDRPMRVKGWIALAGTEAPDDWDDVVAWEHHPDDGAPDVLVDDDDPTQLMYTSGTESRPKGPIMTSRMLIQSTRATWA